MNERVCNSLHKFQSEDVSCTWSVKGRLVESNAVLLFADWRCEQVARFRRPRGPSEPGRVPQGLDARPATEGTGVIGHFSIMCGAVRDDRRSVKNWLAVALIVRHLP